jgi:CBS domain containing-hemolysin-like protein
MNALLIALAILGSAFFSGSETALISVSRLRLRHWVEKKIRGARLAEEFLERPQQMISMALVGTNLMNVTASVLTSRYFSHDAALSLSSILYSSLMVSLIISPPLLLFGEMVPKALFRENASRLLPALSGPLRWGYRLFYPIIAVVEFVSSILLRPFGVGDERPKFFSRDNVELLLRESEKEGVIEPEEREIITGVFAFRETTVREVMTPRTGIVAIERGASPEEIARLMRETGFSRIPLYDGDLDHIVGMVHVFGILQQGKGKEVDARPLVFVPETKPCDDLLYELKARKSHMAIVLDEFGGTAGLVTLEDLVEELVGEIMDEHDTGLQIVAMGHDRTLLVEGRTEIEEVENGLGIELEDVQVETIGGFIVSKLGRIPRTGEEFRMDNIKIEIVESRPNRIEKVLLKVLELGQIDKVEPAENEHGQG